MKKIKVFILCLLMGVPCHNVLAGRSIHTVTPMKITFNKSQRNNIITLSNKGDDKLYFSFSVEKKQADGKMLDITDKGFFTAVPNKLVLDSGETKKVNIYVRNISHIPEGQYIISFTPAKTGKATKLATVDGKELSCHVVVRYAIQADVTH
tara:strand:+ start:2768 stop:3220 length:453 start_codon:yes stop_codon:yes gene_type:complete